MFTLKSLQSFQKYFKKVSLPLDVYSYTPTPFLKHSFAQLIYGACQPKINMKYQRHKVYQKDGGHITLDWFVDEKWNQLKQNSDICLVIHGLTGGSEMNYIKYLLQQSRKQGFRSVGFNSRGISNEMTSPMPFTGISYEQLDITIQHIEKLYPLANIYLVGISFGGNYILRYLLNSQFSSKIKSVVSLAPPFDVNKVVERMNPVYQKMFVRRYIKHSIELHPSMNYWLDNNIICRQKLYNCKTLFDYHENVTVPIVKYPNVQTLFDSFFIGQEIKHLNLPSLIILAKDDPIVSTQDIPYKAMKENKNIRVLETERGSHCCWFEGILPKRWYPKPILHFFNKIRNEVM